MEQTLMSDQFLQPLLDLMQKNQERQDKKLDELNTKIDTNTTISQKALDQTRYTNGRMTKAEADIKALQSQAGRKLNLQPNLLYLIALGALILLVIIAKLLHVELGGLLK